MTSPSPLIAEPLWQRTRASFARAIEAIGTPAAIAALKLLTRDLRRAISGRILRLEHLVRKLLLAEATELHRIEAARAKRSVRIEHIPLRGMAQTWSAGLQTRASARVAEKRGSEDPRSINRANPETWPARFSFALPRNTHLVPNARAPRIRDPWGPDTPPAPERTPRIIRDEDTPFRLACRLEALRRVLADPKPHAARLARVLVREARRVPHLIHRYAFAAARTNDYDKEDYRLGIDVYGACIDAPAAFRDTS